MRDIPRKIYYALTPNQRLLVRRMVFLPIDIFEQVTGRRHPLHPPHGMIFTGRGDFISSGRHFAELLRLYAGLHPGSHILDIGSGIGRLAVGLTDVLDRSGRYEGFDIVKTGVTWCRKHITSMYPNFRFTHIPLHNGLYNISTSDSSDSIEFPYPNENFDIAVSTSVFTHMLHKDVQHYLTEMSRILKPGGRAMITFFCIDNISEPYMTSGDIRFPYNDDNCFIMSQKVPEANVAYRREIIDKLLNEAQLKLMHIIPGRWSGAPEYRSSREFQDTFFVEKK